MHQRQLHLSAALLSGAALLASSACAPSSCGAGSNCAVDEASTSSEDAGTDSDTHGDSESTETGESETQGESSSASSEDSSGAEDSSDAEDSSGETGAVPIRVELTTLDYGEQGETLDLYRPVPAQREAVPILLLAHGGLWQGGSKGELQPTCEGAVQAGAGAIACASLNYRLSGALGGQCQDGDDVYRAQVDDFAAALASLETASADLGLDPAAVVVGGHSAGAHLAAVLYLRWPSFAPTCPGLGQPGDACLPPAGLAGFEGIYDIEAWDAYDDDYWNGQFSCATRRAFGDAPGDAQTCVDADLGLPCWLAGSPTYAAAHQGDFALPTPPGPALLIHSPQDDWVEAAEAQDFGAALSAAFPPPALGPLGVEVVTNGDCGQGRHSQVLSSPELASCLASFTAARSGP